MADIEKYPKLCVTCKHCQFSPYEPGYSSLTPGSEMQMHCGLPLYKVDAAGRRRIVKHSRWDMHDAFSLADAREMLLTAQRCEDYELYVEQEAPRDA